MKRPRRRRFWLDRRDLLAMIAAMAVSASVVYGQTGNEAPSRAAAPEVSRAVYPDSTSSITFSHARHTDVECSACHAAASTSRRSRDDLRPAMTSCASCHATQQPKLRDCAGCHVGYPLKSSEPIETSAQWEEMRPSPMVLPRSAPNLRFDHARHVGRLAKTAPGADAVCTTCHRTDEAGEPAMPAMATCNQCHDGTSAPDTCATCHVTASESGRIRTSFEHDGETRTLRPDNHGVDWKRRHGMVMRSNPTECASCHTEEDCASCHTEKIALPFSVHPPNFVVVHSVDARANLGNCTDCHSDQTFCTTCHVRSSVVTASPNDPPPRRQFHPPGWLDGSLPNNHGVMARRNINDCASCHTENDCVSCHAGIDPHPPEFRLSCRRWLDANPQPCARCHQDLSALRAMCR